MQSIRERDMKMAEAVKTMWVCFPEANTPFEQVLKPEFWAHVAQKVPALSEIYVHPAEGHYYARLLVTYAARQSLRVHVLEYVDLVGEEDQSEDEPVYYKYSGPVAKFRVIRRSDGAVLAEGEEVATREMAEDYIRNYLKALAA